MLGKVLSSYANKIRAGLYSSLKSTAPYLIVTHKP
jgi:hypothetical protein